MIQWCVLLPYTLLMSLCESLIEAEMGGERRGLRSNERLQ